LSYGRRSERNYSPKNNEPTVLKWLGRSYVGINHIDIH